MKLNKFAEMIIPFAIKVNNEIKNGEIFDTKLIDDDPILKNLLENSIMFKDTQGKIWFSTTNIKIIQFITDAYFGTNFRILHIFKKSMNKEEICKHTDLSRTTAHRKINELIDSGLIVRQNKKCSNLSNRRRTDTFCRLFDKLEYTEATNVKVSNMRFCINNNILKINWSKKYA